ncbi:hypothetical protein [Micromonospora echinofusca]|uniref:Secreted protein n=1 Tax=Micromonospora echinofusca TaxID=47858 RepID=A0ABS3W1G1_MICEH|nr:hypothetical protein [Micromonospora echinofusca]MBO4210612.1 hypothetical protein [Micromonospora echinofusca]
MRFTLRAGFGGAAVALAVLASVGISGVTPASAAPAGWQKLSAISASNSVGVKPLTLTCPIGKVVTGGEAWLTASLDAVGRVGLEQFAPSADGRTWTVVMRETGTTDFTGNWQISASAFCVTTPSGYEVVSADRTGWNDYHRISKTVSCTGTKKLLGSGAMVYNTDGAFILDLVEPGFNDAAEVPFYTYARARTLDQAKAAHGLEALRAFAICANKPAALERIRNGSDLVSSSTRNVTLGCPAGKEPYSVGAGIEVSSIHENSRAQVLISGLRSSNTWAHEDPDGYVENWRLSGTVICG